MANNRKDRNEFAEERASLMRITFAPTVWAIHFLLCYAGAAVWCAKFGHTLGVTFLRMSIAALTIAALGAIGALALRSWRQWQPRDTSAEALSKPESRHHFLGHAAFLLSIISAIGVIYVALPALFIQDCR
ncbi:hypothetical protein [Falsirhodobacter algicola]|uniref:Uncharacterized protein n=1 Tax=Falsirhodobacter algicola TaxID=2692330 RepID=A0A8J8SKA9_9RHOB|nr:hypothetical protein [Falsirhodobacter algicola]QUS35263.1 hypothetical protein GR316_02615 [Falsirhodobacter algicola]